MTDRRTLKFDTLADAVRDAEALLATGYDKLGNWNLAQCCGHLAHWVSYPMDGFPKTPLLLRPVFWAIRNTLAPRMFRKAIAAGKTKAGIPTVPASVPPAGGDDAAALAKLREVAQRWETFEGAIHPSPLFGKMAKKQWTSGHLMHAAHHLSFLVPKSG